MKEYKKEKKRKYFLSLVQKMEIREKKRICNKEIMLTMLCTCLKCWMLLKFFTVCT